MKNKLTKRALTLALCALFFGINASSNASYPTGNDNVDPMTASSTRATTNESKDIKSKADYKKLEEVLIKAYENGDASKSFALGGLYSQKFKFNDGVIKAQPEKATFYFEKALSDGFGLAAMPLIKNTIIKTGNIDDALILLERGINGKYTTLIGKTVLAVSYNSLILETKYENIRYVEKALSLTYPISQITNQSSLDFTIANLLNLVGNYEEANKYLNTACNNPEVDPEIKESCDKSVGITNNIKKSKDCETCGVVR